MPSPAAAWTLADVPSLTGRRALVTGANSGIGYHAALELARKGAHVLLASRDRARGEAALARLKREAPGTSAELVLLDLASLGHVRDLSEMLLGRKEPLDLLINNAGVMAPPQRRETADGFELQFGTNVLGHFALTAHLLPLLQAAPGHPRIVTIASIAHKGGKINFDDLQGAQSYDPREAYAQSKLANLLIALELDRRLRAAGSPILSVAAHPGVAKTGIFSAGATSPAKKAIFGLIGSAIGVLLNTDAAGALPTVYAATSPDVVPGGYYGPQGIAEMRGSHPAMAKIAPQALDEGAAARLYEVCEKLTGTKLL